jgi:hypothetical protein
MRPQSTARIGTTHKKSKKRQRIQYYVLVSNQTFRVSGIPSVWNRKTDKTGTERVSYSVEQIPSHEEFASIGMVKWTTGGPWINWRLSTPRVRLLHKIHEPSGKGSTLSHPPLQRTPGSGGERGIRICLCEQGGHLPLTNKSPTPQIPKPLCPVSGHTSSLT